jgi:hypothetical protein
MLLIRMIHNNWSPASGSVILNYGSGSLLLIKDSKKFKEKSKYFIIFNDLLPLFDNIIFFKGLKNAQGKIGNDP